MESRPCRDKSDDPIHVDRDRMERNVATAGVCFLIWCLLELKSLVLPRKAGPLGLVLYCIVFTVKSYERHKSGTTRFATH